MKIIRLANKFNNFIYYFFYFKSIKLAFLLSYYKVDIKNADLISKDGNSIVFNKNGNKISIKQL